MTRPRAWLVMGLLFALGCSEAAAPIETEADGGSGGGAAATGGGATGGGSSGSGGEAACDTIAAELQGVLDQVAQAEALPGAAARVHVAGCDWEGSSGVVDVQTGAPLEPGSLYRIGSSTKTFVAVALLLEVADGHLSLDDTIDAWAPEIANAPQITLRQALNHTSGVYSYTDADEFWDVEPGHAWTPLELVAIAAQKPPYFSPGESWQYSNTNYVVAGLAVEAASGLTVAQAIRARILVPLGLTDTWFDGEEDPIGELPKSYASYAGQSYDVSDDYHPSAAWAAGAIASSNQDIERFYQALLGGELLDQAQLAELETFVDLGQGYGYGLGLFRFPSPLGDRLGHGGAIPGFLSENGVYPDADAAITQFITLYDPNRSLKLLAALEAVVAAR